MTKTPSHMVPLGTDAVGFELPDVVSGKQVKLHDGISYKATVIMFICNHCPYVRHIFPGLVPLANDYMNKGVRFIAINSNDIDHYPDDAPDKMVTTAKDQGFHFPYLFDETQEVAKSYHAACTPDIFIYDDGLQLAYRGQFDDSRPGNKLKVTGKSVREALDCLIQGKQVSQEQKASIGCNIKWKE